MLVYYTDEVMLSGSYEQEIARIIGAVVRHMHV